MARDGLRLVYGGGNIGLKGTIAAAVLAVGGEVVGQSVRPGLELCEREGSIAADQRRAIGDLVDGVLHQISEVERHGPQ